MAKPKAYGPGITTQRIAECMRQQKLTQAALAESMNKSSQTICRWVNGKVNISSADLEKLATILDTTLDYLQGTSNTRSRVDQERQDKEFWDEFGNEFDGEDQWINECRRKRRILNCFFKEVCGYSYSEDTSAAVDFGGKPPHKLTDQNGNIFEFSESEFQQLILQIKDSVDFACFKISQQNGEK